MNRRFGCYKYPMFWGDDLYKTETPKWFQRTMHITIAVAVYEYGLIAVLHFLQLVRWLFSFS